MKEIERNQRCQHPKNRRGKDFQLPVGNNHGLTDQKVKGLQMILWAGVVLIQLFVVGNLQVQAMEPENCLEEPDIVTIQSKIWDRQEDCPVPEENYKGENGTEYKLFSWEVEPVTVPARKELVEKEGFCSQVEGLSKVPETAIVTVEKQGRSTDVVCQLAEKTVIGEEWEDGFYFPVIFHGYDAGVYWLQGHLISGSEEAPRLDGCEELLLEEIGANPEEYQILGIRWDGEAYGDENGEICRRAEAWGQKLVRDYQLLYRGSTEIPAYRAWRTSAVYEPIKIDEFMEETSPETFGNERTQPEETQPILETETISLWERITKTLFITIAIGAVLFFGGLILLAILWLMKALQPYGRRKKEKGEQL